MTQRSKFLIMSNARAGSTWLETMLGALPDTLTDYEFKWNVTYAPRTIHYVLKEDSPAVADILDEFDDGARVIGAKFVFDPMELPQLEWEKLRSKLGRSLRIVHLIRHYREMFLSSRRGFIHEINQASSWKIGEHLRSIFGSTPSEPVTPAVVTPEACHAELMTYLQNDLRVLSLLETGAPYLRVSYEQLSAKMFEVAGFVGSAAKRSAVSAIMECPVTLKLPTVPPDRLIQNLDELEPIFEQVELIREYAFRRAHKQFGSAPVLD